MVLTQLHMLLVSNANDDSDFSVHGINFSNSRVQGSSSCALSVTVTQLCLVYKLQRLVTSIFSIFAHLCLLFYFVMFVILVFYTYMSSL